MKIKDTGIFENNNNQKISQHIQNLRLSVVIVIKKNSKCPVIFSTHQNHLLIDRYKVVVSLDYSAVKLVIFFSNFCHIVEFILDYQN